MNNSRILGLIVLVAGVGLLIFGMRAAQSIRERLMEGFTGNFSESTTWYLMGGVAAILVGLAICLFGGRNSSR